MPRTDVFADYYVGDHDLCGYFQTPDWGPDDDDYNLYGGDPMDDYGFYLTYTKERNWEEEQWRAWDKSQEIQTQFQLADEEDWFKFETASSRHTKKRKWRIKKNIAA